jgi:hypothetical protein
MHVGTTAGRIDGYATKVTPPARKVLDPWHEATTNGEKGSHLYKLGTCGA